MSDKKKDMQVKKADDGDKGTKNNGALDTMEIVPKKSLVPLIAGGVVAAVIVVVLAVQLKSAHTALDASTAAVQKSQNDISELQKELQRRTESAEAAAAEFTRTKSSLEEQVSGLESALKSTESEIGALKDENEQTKQELSQFKAFSAKFKRMVDAGKLEVVFRRGRMVVNLPAQVLFDSGSADLSDEGQKQLAEVAAILRTVKDKRFVVGGHTDDQKIKKAKFESNWALSTARALAVTNVLVRGGVKPSNLAAAGFAQFAPIASNKTEEGRQKNRRIEIILEPKLKDIQPPAPKGKSGKK